MIWLPEYDLVAHYWGSLSTSEMAFPLKDFILSNPTPHEIQEFQTVPYNQQDHSYQQH